ncbi:hypothetical protein [uncultured Flavobacterium sp.]|uniref:hypothetical protein n=1 Tax=uncultured Flavobacterium sp. TaxID=165435 RepID=UPI0030CA1482|tara:strand:- start:3123 stop:3350 length:228 start_codon:yes stop_codon:yes gene_type:complete
MSIKEGQNDKNAKISRPTVLPESMNPVLSSNIAVISGPVPIKRSINPIFKVMCNLIQIVIKAVGFKFLINFRVRS